MVLAAVAFAQLLRACAPAVSPRTMTALVQVESGGNPLAIHDNTLGRAYFPSSRSQAVAWGTQLSALGHSLDFGLSQINSVNLPRLGVSVDDIFDPCTNLHAGSTILSEDYLNAVRRFGAGQYALRRALGAYNTGSLFAGQDYVNEILSAAGLAPEEDYPVAATADPSTPAPREWTAQTAHKKGSKHARVASAPAVPQAAYSLQHTSGSPVVIIVGR